MLSSGSATFCESKLCWSGLGGAIGLAAAGGIGSAIGAVGFAAGGAVAVAAFVGGLVHAGVVACNSGSVFGTVLVCGSVRSSSIAVLVREYGRLARDGSCGGSPGFLVAEESIPLMGIRLGELFGNNALPGFFA